LRFLIATKILEAECTQVTAAVAGSQTSA